MEVRSDALDGAGPRPVGVDVRRSRIHPGGTGVVDVVEGDTSELNAELLEFPEGRRAVRGGHEDVWGYQGASASYALALLVCIHGRAHVRVRVAIGLPVGDS